jgi:4-amino-4-deoxy-L-arabinose transferase-like glycosyltransferase
MRRRHFLVTAAAFAYIAAAALSSSLSTGLDHDEHQFMASAYLVAEHNLHPYQDFPYFHMPNLVYIYAAFFRLTDYPFLSARLFSALCAAGISLMIFFVSRSLWFKDDERTGFTIAVSAALLFTNSQLFASAAAQVWNHGSPTLCALLAFVFHCQALRRSMSWKYSLLSGFLLGMAIGIRLSFAPLIVPFLAIMFVPPARDARRTWRGVLAFGIGGLAANLPALYFLATSIEQFLFGNFVYPSLNTLYRQEMNYDRAMTLGGKVSYLIQDVLSKPGDLLIAVVFVYGFLGVKLEHIRHALASRLEFAFLLLLLPFLCLGAFAPTPSQYQYFFAPVPFLIMVIPQALASFRGADDRRPGVRLLVLAAIFSVAFNQLSVNPAAFLSLFRPDSWYPVHLHQISAEIGNQVAASHGGTKILTLSPLYPTETRLPIYPEFATGQFAWRIGHLLSPADRKRQSVVAPADIEEFIAREAPLAILTTSEARSLRQPLAETARKHGYRERKLSDGGVLWIAPP